VANNSAKTATVTYADAGVDIDRGNRTKKRIKYLAHKTFTKGVLSEIGGFGGLFAVDKEKFIDPVLVSSVDGVGTKLKVAFAMKLHSTVGADLVNHCVNDIAGYAGSRDGRTCRPFDRGELGARNRWRCVACDI